MKVKEPILLILNNLVHVVSIVELIIQNVLHSEEIQEVEQLEIILILKWPGSAHKEGAILGFRLLCSLAERIIDFDQILNLAFIVAVIPVAARGNKCSSLLGSLKRIILVVKLLNYSLFAFQLVKAQLDPILLKDCEDFVNVYKICQIDHINQANVLIWSECFSICAQKAPEQAE